MDTTIERLKMKILKIFKASYYVNTDNSISQGPGREMKEKGTFNLIDLRKVH